MSLNVIGGSLRGKRLFSPEGRDIRPTAGRVREALFNILADKIREAVVLDLFAGTGAMGIEALSRGAARAVFVDAGETALAAIEKNIRACNLSAQARVVNRDATGNLRDLAPSDHGFDIVFMDPPYRQERIAETLQALGQSGILNAAATVTAEHSKHEPVTENICAASGFTLMDQRKYGKSLVSLMRNI